MSEWINIHLTMVPSVGCPVLFNAEALDAYNITNGTWLTARSDWRRTYRIMSREQLLQIGERQYLRHPRFGEDVTVKDLKKWICKIEGDDGLYDKIVFENEYWMSRLLHVEDLPLWKCDELWGDEHNLRVLYVKMKGTGQWYIEYKWERFCKLCTGYCREIEQEYVMNMPWYLKNIVRNYCNHFDINENYLYHHVVKDA